MAVVSVIIGGFGGFLAFLAAWLFLDFSFLSSFALYLGTGTLSALIVIVAAYVSAVMHDASQKGMRQRATA
ncbi:MAG: hypothetical protein NXH82_01260 [Rhodobacteraceae bacterium]|nr:hypothetical protein [Paracoccaceae bacterium]